MTMKETVFWLRLQLVLTGGSTAGAVLLVLPELFPIRFEVDELDGLLVIWSSIVLYLGFATAFIVAGVRLTRRKGRRTGRIRKMLGLSIVLHALSALLTALIVDLEEFPAGLAISIFQVTASGYFLGELLSLSEEEGDSHP